MSDGELMVLTGEPSGDAYGAAVVACLRRRLPQLGISAMGGPLLAGSGATIIQDSAGLAVMGFLPVLTRLPEFLALGRRLAQLIRERRPRVVLTIDYPGFNLRLARRCRALRRQGMRFVHLVAPQVWAWKPRRAKTVAMSVDRLLCFFPFEPPLFTRFGCQADFVGHPLLDLIPPASELRAAWDAEQGWRADERLLLIAPGSREREINTLLPLFDRAARAVVARVPGAVRVVVAAVPEQNAELYRRHTAFPLVTGRYRQLCARAQAGFIASGTATLEAGLLGLPHVIAYRADRIQAALARRLVITEHVGLPNIVARRRIVPEVLQEQLGVPRLVAHLLRLWQGPRREACLADLAAMRLALGAGGALERIAGIIAAELAPSPAAQGGASCNP